MARVNGAASAAYPSTIFLIAASGTSEASVRSASTFRAVTAVIFFVFAFSVTSTSVTIRPNAEALETEIFRPALARERAKQGT